MTAKKRNGEAQKRLGGKLFYTLINGSSATPIPSDVTIARIMSKEYVDSFTVQVRQIMNAVTSFSNKPLYAIFALGACLFLMCIAAVTWLTLQS